MDMGMEVDKRRMRWESGIRYGDLYLRDIGGGADPMFLV